MHLTKLFAEKFRTLVRQWHWRRNPTGYLRSLGMQVGEHCRFLERADVVFGSEPYLIKLGNHVTITSGVRFVTHDGGVWVFRDQFPDMDVFGSIVVGNNVFIGFNSIILPGVRIGDNCVIGAGSVVTRDIPANSVAAGTPARVIRSLDEYFLKSKRKATFVRSLSPEQLRTLLTEQFFPGEAGPPGK